MNGSSNQNISYLHWFIDAGFSCRVGGYLIKIDGQGRRFVLSFAISI